MQTSTPWKLGTLSPSSPTSLRLAALQIAYVPLNRLKYYTRTKKWSWWKELAECRLHKPEVWADLCRVLKIDRETIEPQPRELRRIA